MSLELVSDTPPAEVAWEAFDRAAIVLQRMYGEGCYHAAERRKQALQVVKLWGEFMALASEPDEPRPGA